MTALDTTWRMAIPILSGFILGLVADKTWGTTPWIMILGLILGIGLSALLITKQLKALYK
jgi:F0F1-type ATP synthase assembly protein I